MRGNTLMGVVAVGIHHAQLVFPDFVSSAGHWVAMSLESAGVDTPRAAHCEELLGSLTRH